MRLLKRVAFFVMLILSVEPSFLAIRVRAVDCDDDMVEEAKIHGFACFSELACDVVVLRRRL